MNGFKGFKSGGLVSEVGKKAKSSAVKVKKATFREAGQFAEKAGEQVTGIQKGPLPTAEPDVQKEKEQEETRIRQLRATLRKVADWQKQEEEKIKQERERLAKLREEAIGQGKDEGEEEKKEKFGSLDWFKDVGKKTKGLAVKRKKKELKPAGFKG